MLADPAFGRQELYALLEEIGRRYTIRFRENIVVYEGEGSALKAAAYAPVNEKGVKDSWCMATSRANDEARS